MGTSIACQLFDQVNTLYAVLEANAADMAVTIVAAVIVVLAFVIIALVHHRRFGLRFPRQLNQ